VGCFEVNFGAALLILAAFVIALLPSWYSPSAFLFQYGHSGAEQFPK
jgi:hypothetical protein